MRKALAYCCQSCNWQHMVALNDGDSTMNEAFDHCPWCLLVHRAARLQTLAASFTRPGHAASCQHGK